MGFKLIREEIEHVEYLTEGDGASRKLYMHGPFLQGAIQNRNGRIYPMAVLEPEAARYIRESIEVGSGWGELSHPNSPSINPERVSHRTVSLVKENTDYIGKALVISDNPCGAIVQGLINSGGRVGVSSRALGSLKENSQGIMEVQADLRIATCADVVLDPSAPSAFVRGIMEGVSWTQHPVTGEFIKEQAEIARKEIEKLSLRQIDEQKVMRMAKFIQALSNAKNQ
jgi:hypothetical protein